MQGSHLVDLRNNCLIMRRHDLTAIFPIDFEAVITLGGLWLALITMPAIVLNSRTANESSGVERNSRNK